MVGQLYRMESLMAYHLMNHSIIKKSLDNNFQDPVYSFIPSIGISSI